MTPRGPSIPSNGPRNQRQPGKSEGIHAARCARAAAPGDPAQFPRGRSEQLGRTYGSGRPYTTAGGKNSHVRVQRVDNPGVTETRLWGSYEKVTVIRRANTDEGKR